MCAEVAQLLLGDFAFKDRILHCTLLNIRGQVFVGRCGETLDLGSSMSLISTYHPRSRIGHRFGVISHLQAEIKPQSRGVVLPRQPFDC